MSEQRKPLTEELGDDHRRLVSQLHRLKDQSGLSYARLARKTHYSRSSWARFLSAEQFPTRQAVLELARVCEYSDPEQLGLLWDRARNDVPCTLKQEPKRVDGTVVAAEEDYDTAECAEPHQLTSRPVGLLRRTGVLLQQNTHTVLVAVLAALAGAAIATPLTLMLASERDGKHAVTRPAAEQQSVPRAQQTTQTSPAARCRAGSCYRKDPQAMRCDTDSRTVRTTWNLGMRIELRYSPTCHAAWGRITGAKVDDVVQVSNDAGQITDAAVRYGRTKYTPMISAPSPDIVWACGITPQRKTCTRH